MPTNRGAFRGVTDGQESLNASIFKSMFKSLTCKVCVNTKNIIQQVRRSKGVIAAVVSGPPTMYCSM